MDLPPDKAKLLKQYDNEKKWDIICDQVSDFLESLFPRPFNVQVNSIRIRIMESFAHPVEIYKNMCV